MLFHLRAGPCPNFHLTLQLFNSVKRTVEYSFTSVFSNPFQSGSCLHLPVPLNLFWITYNFVLNPVVNLFIIVKCHKIDKSAVEGLGAVSGCSVEGLGLTPITRLAADIHVCSCSCRLDWLPCSRQIQTGRLGETAQWLKVLAALPDDEPRLISKGSDTFTDACMQAEHQCSWKK